MKKKLLIFIAALVLVFLAGGTAMAANAAAGTDHTKAIITLIILAMSAVMFITEIVPLPVTAILVPVALSFPGIDVLTGPKAFSFFGDQWVIIFMAMFIVGEAMFRTGFAGMLGESVVKLAGKSERKLLLLVMITVGLMSSLLSNTGTAAVFVPIVLAVCASANIKPSKILMPMAYATSLGGCLTVIGTPPNGIINSAIENAVANGTFTGIQPFGFFEFAKVGIILFIFGILYFALIGHRILPEAQGDSNMTADKADDFVYRTNKMPIAIVIFAFVVIAMASGFVNLVTASMLGAALVVATGCITMKEAFESVSWTTIFLFAGMLSMSEAMSVSGGAELIATTVVQHVSSPMVLLMVIYIVTTLMTEVMSNTATCALLAPIAIAIAQGFGVSPLPILLTMSLGASACFLTPIGTPPNTIVFGPGGYKFTDYAKTGWMLQVGSAIIIFIIVPILYPF